MLVNGEPLDALASVMHRSLVERRGRAWVKKLKPMVERQYFEVVIQAAVGRRVIARETVQPFRKDVTAKLYGGDHTRRKKLLEKQKVAYSCITNLIIGWKKKNETDWNCRYTPGSVYGVFITRFNLIDQEHLK